ncbi:helix-turn-helix domain-containing protein [Limosilactobacillus sp. RRLNB_1_1]|uniref:Helix-turn-helix domain-containing protein n=1 Tax=Limosilactobacillus albertensis TaxID=2759752 RepID=A0A7W3TPZ3_9LACO|nr:helix-turn-helix domain-containing protein [Limosilactobacillus albertensis]
MNNTVEFKLPTDLQEAIKQIVSSSVAQIITETQQKNNYRPYMTKQETASYLHIAPKTLLDWEAKYKDIPTIEIDGVKRYRRTDLDNWMETRKLNK